MHTKSHRSKSHKRRHSRRHSRRHTRKNGGGCGCSMRPQFGGRGGMGGAELGHAFTSGASQELYQYTGTPGLSSGGAKGSKARRTTRKRRLETAAAEREAAAAERERRNMVARRHREFRNHFVYGMPIPGYEGNEYKHLNRNEIKNKIKLQALSEYVSVFGNNEGFNELNLNLNNNNNNNNNNNKNKKKNNKTKKNNRNMNIIILPANKNYVPKLHELENN